MDHSILLVKFIRRHDAKIDNNLVTAHREFFSVKTAQQ
jgi:hypothetical protein